MFNAASHADAGTRQKHDMRIEQSGTPAEDTENRRPRRSRVVRKIIDGYQHAAETTPNGTESFAGDRHHAAAPSDCARRFRCILARAE